MRVKFFIIFRVISRGSKARMDHLILEGGSEHYKNKKYMKTYDMV